MKYRVWKILGISTLAAAAFSLSAFAETITNVSFEAGCDAEATINYGEPLAPEFVVNDVNATYELTSATDSSSSEAYRSPRTYELTFEAGEGYSFPTSTSEIQVTGKGITEIVSKKVDKDNDSILTVRVKSYPYYAWETPAFKEEDITKKVSWSRPSGASTEYLITWVAQNGETKHVHSTTSSASLSLTSYNKAYTGKNEEYSDSYVEGVAIRIKGSAGDNPRTAPSDWAVLGEVSLDDFENIDTYNTWGDLFEGVSGMGGTVSRSASGEGSGSIGPGSVILNGWQLQNGAWYLFENGTAHKGWYWDGANWYYLDPASGMMKTGWIIDNNFRYYLNPNEGGPQGAMVTGTQYIDGKTCVFDASGALQSES